tara:strand:+ start:147 stop:476 length:330 start_codon:yes stop_codon:yes gene_type:complete
MSKSELREEYEARFGVVDGPLRLYNADGNQIYREYPSGYWVKYEFDAEGYIIYYEHSNGYWAKREFDAEGRRIYFENSKEGVVCDKRTCSDKVFIDEQSGKKFKLTEIK